MEKVKHTPGPWRIDDSVHDIEILADPGFPCRYFGEEGIWPIAKAMNLHHDDDGSGGVMEANARLIAAAPELLEALREAEEYFYNHADADHDDTGFVPNKEMKLLTVVRAAIAKAEGRS